jgi:hypothetical protein
MVGQIPALFDPYFYRKSVAEPCNDEALYQHYATTGWRRGLSPSPYFLAPWYLEQNPDVKQGDWEPLQHFMLVGAKQLRNPHPTFEMHWYHEQYGDDSDYLGDPIAHYRRFGWARGCKPHPLFWTAWYARKYLSKRPDVDPFNHYLTEGWQAGCQPNPLFDGEWYLRQASEGGHPVKSDPLSDYIDGWYRRFDPHPLFNTAYFMAQQGADGVYFDRSPLELYFTDRSHVSPSPLFDQDFFLRKLEESGRGAEDADLPALVRYLEQSATGGVDPHPFFSRRTYRLNAPDVARAGDDPLYHYAVHGWKECRKFHPLFEAQYYRSQCGEGFAEDPLTHYLQQGAKKGLLPRRPKHPDQVTRPLPASRYILEVSTKRTAGPKEAVPAGGPVAIGAFIHIFHTDLAAELIGYTNNLPPGGSQLFITTDTPAKAHEIETVCRTRSQHPFEIRVLENRGRDLAPFLTGYADRLREVTYGVHIHSKKSLHYGREFDAWRHHLLFETLGSPALVLNILNLLTQDGIGMVAPDHFEPIKRLIQWGGNFDMAAGLLELAGEHLTPDHTLDFPSGSMFWFKTDALRKLLALELRSYHFDPEAGQYDGTLAHAIERSLFYFAEAAGYRWIVSRASATASPPLANDNAQGHAPFAGNRIFPTDHELGLLRKYYAECTRAVCVASRVGKPRINLLIPTVDTSQAYAGVTTALELFAALRAELGDEVDARILTTDISPNQQYLPPTGYSMARPGAADLPRCDVVEDAAQRFRYPILMRDTDILFATAWWTASFALDCLAQQDRLFGERPRKMIYLIQDYEPGFYAQSTKYALAQQTYLRPERTIPIFNSRSLRDYFLNARYYDRGHVLDPGMNQEIRDGVHRNTPKERIVLLYARPHAERNCLSFVDIVVGHTVALDPQFWSGWRFCAIGETFGTDVLKVGGVIELLGRLSIAEYAALASRAAIGVSLMVAPHPSYPPLEMAESGMLVLANTYGARDPAELHDNIASFPTFDVDAVSAQLLCLARTWADNPQAGWNGRPRVDWFFAGQTNIGQLCSDLAEEILPLGDSVPKTPPASRASRASRAKKPRTMIADGSDRQAEPPHTGNQIARNSQ